MGEEFCPAKFVLNILMHPRMKEAKCTASVGSSKCCFGPQLQDDEHACYEAKKNVKWYGFKKTLIHHFSGQGSKTHRDAVHYQHLMKPLKTRE